jgi:hypothetical protein
MKRIILLIALSIDASMAIADSNPSTYDDASGVLVIPEVIIDDVHVTDSVTLQLIEITSSGNYLFELDPTTVTLNKTPVEPGVPQGTYKIGDRGPYGGKVFYISPDGSGMEAALTDAGKTQWGCDGVYVQAIATTIGTGQLNTENIIDKCGESTAAYLASNYTWPNGQKGGSLPSKDELKLLYDHKDVVGGFANDYYWSSSEGYSNGAWIQSFYNGSQPYSSKYSLYTYLVRAVRAF